MAFSLVRASSVEPKAPREDAILARMEGDENRSPAAAQLPRSERNAMAAGCERPGTLISPRRARTDWRAAEKSPTPGLRSD